VQPEEVKISFHEFIFRDTRIKGSLICSPEESKTMLQAIVEHGIKVKTNNFLGLETVQEVLALVHSSNLARKAVVVVNPEQLEDEWKIGAKF
jgi:D-arabinose 1-dehydrogenase-like Zn-dependent alcohol dehydrogenase